MRGAINDRPELEGPRWVPASGILVLVRWGTYVVTNFLNQGVYYSPTDTCKSTPLHNTILAHSLQLTMNCAVKMVKMWLKQTNRMFSWPLTQVQMTPIAVLSLTTWACCNELYLHGL